MVGSAKGHKLVFCEDAIVSSMKYTDFFSRYLDVLDSFKIKFMALTKGNSSQCDEKAKLNFVEKMEDCTYPHVLIQKMSVFQVIVTCGILKTGLPSYVTAHVSNGRWGIGQGTYCCLGVWKWN